jgi:hypothetical protein
MHVARLLAWDNPVRIVSSVNDAYAAEDAALAKAEAAKAEAAELLAAVGAVRRVARRAVRGSASSGALPPARSELLRLAARRPGIGVAGAAPGPQQRQHDGQPARGGRPDQPRSD